MSQVAVVYHSGYGHTKALAERVAKGAGSVPGVEALLISVEDIDSHWESLDKADAIIFGAPTYMGAASAQFKAFADASSKRWFTHAWKDKIAGGFTNSGSQFGDKGNTMVEFATLAAQHGMIWVSLGLMPGNNNSKGSVNDLNRLGGALGAYAQSNVDQGGDVAPIESDRATAEHLGKRVAEIAVTFKRGRA
jgi:multimeric flavodoxin WrbA